MQKIIFIYNAKNHIINSVFDYFHKLISPKTYSCNLCSITYSNTGKISEWKTYLKSLPFKIIFTYKNKLQNNKLGINYNDKELPCVLLLNKKKQITLISNYEMNTLNNLNELIFLLDQKISNIK